MIALATQINNNIYVSNIETGSLYSLFGGAKASGKSNSSMETIHIESVV